MKETLKRQQLFQGHTFEINDRKALEDLLQLDNILDGFWY